jgi:N-acetylglucosaminyl transferase component (Gpi1)
MPDLRFYNSLWLLFNDVVIGWSFGTFLLENKDALSEIFYHRIQVCGLLVVYLSYSLALVYDSAVDH